MGETSNSEILTFERLYALVEDRLSKIEVDKDKFTVKKQYIERLQGGDIIVLFGDCDFLKLHFLVERPLDGPAFRKSTTVHLVKYANWFHNHLNWRLDIDFHVNENSKCHNGFAENIPLQDVLNKYLPISNDKDKDEITYWCNLIGLKYDSILFNTKERAYEIESPEVREFMDVIKENLNDVPLFLHKYVSLDTLLAMLEYRTFRMNSIVSMNDIDETLWATVMAGNSIKDDQAYYENILANKNYLITSFTDKADDATLWRLYGNNGCGVDITFNLPIHTVRKIKYIDTDDKLFNKLREISMRLGVKNIRIKYNGLEMNRFYIKSSSYNVEGEYRFVYDAGSEDLPFANYGGLLSPYKDFAYNPKTNGYEGLPFTICSLRIGRNIPFYKTNEPLLFDKIYRTFPNVSIYDSKVQSLR